MCHVHSTVRTLKTCSVTVLKHDSVIDTHNMNVLIFTILSYWCQIGAVEHMDFLIQSLTLHNIPVHPDLNTLILIERTVTTYKCLYS